MAERSLRKPVDVIGRGAVGHQNLHRPIGSVAASAEVDAPVDLLPGTRVAPRQPPLGITCTVELCRRGVRHLGAGQACEAVPPGARPVRVTVVACVTAAALTSGATGSFDSFCTTVSGLVAGEGGELPVGGAWVRRRRGSSSSSGRSTSSGSSSRSSSVHLARQSHLHLLYFFCHGLLVVTGQTVKGLCLPAAF